MLCQPMSSSPYSFGRPSSPLNPHSDRSSSPPSSSSCSSTAGLRQRSVHNPSSPSPNVGHKTRYQRPNQTKYLASAPSELFAEGTTPTEALMWREKFSKRVEDRERRRQSREGAIDRRRGGLDVFEEEDEEKARADDEEIFRRLMVNQRRKAEHAAAMALEVDNGGSSPTSPDFWDEEALEAQQGQTQQQHTNGQPLQPVAGPSKYQTPLRQSSSSRPPTHRPHQYQPFNNSNADMEPDEELWAMEAARAEEAEREAEAEMARLMEESHQNSPHRVTPAAEEDLGGMDIDMDMDWDMESD